MGHYESHLNSRSPEFQTNRAAMQQLVDDLYDKVAKITEGGGERSREKHLSRGKLLPRDRIDMLTDDNSPFLEIGQMAALGVYEDDVPAAGIITGVTSFGLFVELNEIYVEGLIHISNLNNDYYRYDSFFSFSNSFSYTSIVPPIKS